MRSHPVRVEWTKEGLRFDASTAHGRFAMASALDEPGHGATPMEVLAVALAGCTAMDVASILLKMREPLGEFSVEVAGERADEHPKRYLSMEVVYRLRGALDEKNVQRAIQLSEEKYCSAAATLRPGVRITSRYVIDT